MAQSPKTTKATALESKATKKKRATKSAKQRPSVSEKPKVDSFYREIVESITPLLKAFSEPSLVGRKTAKEIIEKFAVADSVPKTISKVGFAKFFLYPQESKERCVNQGLNRSRNHAGRIDRHSL